MCKQTLLNKEVKVKEALDHTEEMLLISTTNPTWEPDTPQSDDVRLTQGEIVKIAAISAILTYLFMMIFILLYYCIIAEISSKDG